MYKNLYALSLFTALSLITLSQGHAQDPRPDLLRVNTPSGVKIVSIPLAGFTTPEAVIAYYSSPFSREENLPVSKTLLSEKELRSQLKINAEQFIVKMIRMTTLILKLKGVTLNKAANAQVSYNVAPFSSRGWTSDGFIADCWDCGSSPNARQSVARFLGLKSTNLYRVVSENPRFTAVKINRGSANIVNFKFETVQKGTIEISLVIQSEENYHPFVADLPSDEDGKFGNQIYGTSQLINIWASTELLIDNSDFKSLKTLIGIPLRVSMYGLNRMAIVSEPIDSTTVLPNIFKNVQYAGIDIPSSQRPSDLERQTRSDIKKFIDLSNNHLNF